MATTTPSATLMTITGSSSSGMPPATDGQPGSETSGSSSSNDNGSLNSTGSLVNYYFVFLALIVCVAGLSGFLLWRRRKRAMIAVRMSRENALARDVTRWQGDARQEGRLRGYWHGRWRSQEDIGREEGLNEYGEAPPAYAPPKSGEEEEREAAARGPAVPMQTLSRQDAGLKPPDYVEASVTLDSPERRPGGEGSSNGAERRSET